MNCKPGDLAVIVRGGFEEVIGILCRVTSSSDTDKDGDFCWLVRTQRAVPWFDADDPLSVIHGRNGFVPDAWLRPIRDQPGEDETLSWAGKPQKVKA